MKRNDHSKVEEMMYIKSIIPMSTEYWKTEHNKSYKLISYLVSTGSRLQPLVTMISCVEYFCTELPHLFEERYSITSVSNPLESFYGN